MECQTRCRAPRLASSHIPFSFFNCCHADITAPLLGNEPMRQALRDRLERTRNLKVFLSSPFGGLERERATFVEQFLPLLRAQCSAKGVTLSLVDLRWGITEAQAAANLTLQICLQEIDRCDLFVGCYGRRYGTRHSATEPAGPTHWVQDALAQAANRWATQETNGDSVPIEQHGVWRGCCCVVAVFVFVRGCDCGCGCGCFAWVWLGWMWVDGMPEPVAPDWFIVNHRRTSRRLAC